MFSSTLVQTAFFLVLATRHVAAADLQTDTPTLTQCQDAKLTWSGGKGSYGVYVVPSEDSCADSLVDIPEQNGNSYTWKVNVPAGSQVKILVEDSAEVDAWSGIVTVQNSTDASCVDPKAAQALAAASGSSSSSSSASSSSAASSTGYPTPSTTLVLPTASGAVAAAAAKTVEPATATPGIANAASGSNSPTSGSIPRATLPAGSFLAAAAFVLALAQL